MDVLEFQKKLEGICVLAERNNKKLTTEQVREYFEASELEKKQLLKILQYLKVKGISIEGLPEKTEDTEPEIEEEVHEPLTKEEEEYLKNYLEGLSTDKERGNKSG